MRKKKWWTAADNLHLVGIGTSISVILLLTSISIGVPGTALFFIKCIALILFLIDIYNLVMYFIRKRKGTPVLSEEDSLAVLERYAREHSASTDIEERELVLAIQTVLHKGDKNTIEVKSDIAGYRGILDKENTNEDE